MTYIEKRMIDKGLSPSAASRLVGMSANTYKRRMRDGDWTVRQMRALMAVLGIDTYEEFVSDWETDTARGRKNYGVHGGEVPSPQGEDEGVGDDGRAIGADDRDVPGGVLDEAEGEDGVQHAGGDGDNQAPEAPRVRPVEGVLAREDGLR